MTCVRGATEEKVEKDEKEKKARDAGLKTKKHTVMWGQKPGQLPKSHHSVTK